MDIGYHEGKVENAVPNAHLAVSEAVAGDFRAVCGLEFPGVGASCTLLGRWWDNGPQGSSVYEPLGRVIGISCMEEVVTA